MTKVINKYHDLNLIEMAKHRLMLEEFLVKRSNLSVRDNEGRNALYWAIKYRSKHNVALLLKYDISLMVDCDTHAIFHAIAHNDYDTFIMLLNKKVVGLDIKDTAGMTLLMRAIQAESVPMVRYLINHGANLYLEDSEGNVALDYAKSSKNRDVFNLVHYRIIYEQSQKNSPA